MKRILTVLFLLTGIAATAAELPAHLLEMQKEYKGRIKVGSVSDSTVRDDNDEKYEALKFSTTQYTKDHALHYQLRVTVELSNRKTGESGFAQLSETQKGFSGKITGAIDWEFQIPHGAMGKRAKITAYAIEYGLVEGDVFVPIAGDYDDVDSAAEITERTTTPLPGLKRTEKTIWVHTN